MPNHITNQITFGSDSKALSEFHKMLQFIKADDSFLGSVDFNKLIPMPQELAVESGSRGNQGLKLYSDFLEQAALLVMEDLLLTLPDEVKKQRATEHLARYDKLRNDDPEMWALGEKYYSNLQKYGATTWYDWCISHWGTKWNAYHCSQADEHTDTLQFDTAWAGVPMIVEKLSERFPSATLTYRFSDENIGFNVGEIIYKNGQVVEATLPVEGSREAYDMAAEIQGIDLKEYGFVLSKDGSTYEYRDEDDVPDAPPPAPAKEEQKKKPREQSR